MINPRTEKVYSLFIDYLIHEQMTIADCIGIMEGFEQCSDYYGALGVYNALCDYVQMIPLKEFI